MDLYAIYYKVHERKQEEQASCSDAYMLRQTTHIRMF
jgi:hypothetical protein